MHRNQQIVDALNAAVASIRETYEEVAKSVAREDTATVIRDVLSSLSHATLHHLSWLFNQL
jgi:hypothetical protein